MEDESEGVHMAKVLGDKRILIMRNHGAMIVGETVARAYLDAYQLERACMYQLLAVAGGGVGSVLVALRSCASQQR